MRFVRYTAGGSPEHGVLTEGGITPLTGTTLAPLTLDKLANEAYLDRVRSWVEHVEPTLSREEARLLAPVETPGKIVCIGLNYHDHAEESGDEPPEEPKLFGKAPTAVTNPGDPIVHPDVIEEVDYEVELGVVIGREARDVSADEAREYVAGYTVVNDVSGRDAQFSDGQWFRGKSFDTFAPMGPALVTGDFEPNAADVELRVNGEVKQSSNTEEFVFDVDELVEYVSRMMTLRPGDVISTGTPGGVGIFRDPPDLLEPGDTVVAEVDGIGALENPVVAEK